MPRFDLPRVSRRLLRVPAPHDDAATDARAAVSIVLREPSPGEELDILFIRRSERPHDPWSGHVAFPGGRHDLGDASMLATALRETHEEVGLRLDEQGALLARLPDMPARARGKRVGLTISPFVFALSDPSAPLVLDPREVADIVWMPLAALARGEGRGTHAFEYGSERYELPSLAVGPYVLWGLTYAMLQTLLSVLEGEDADHAAHAAAEADADAKVRR